MKKKLLALVVALALSVSMLPAAAFAATSDSGVQLTAGVLAAPQKAGAVDSTAVLYATDGYLWHCDASGARVSKDWDTSSISSSVKKVYIESGVTTLPKKAKLHYVSKYSGTTDYDENIVASRTTELRFLLSGGKSSCSKIASDAFDSGYNLSTIVNLDKTQISTFDKDLFRSSAVKSIVAPKTLKTISENAIAWCKSLTTVDLSATAVTTIGKTAFSNCTALKTIKLPKTLKTVGERAFTHCSKLTTLSGLNKTKLTAVKNGVFEDCTALKTVVLPNTCKTIGDDAFWGCTKLSKITFGSKTSKIGSWAFRGCKSLKSITLPATCKKLGSYAFSNCSKLKKVVLKSKSVIKNARKASYYMDDAFLNTPIAKKSGSAKIYVPKSVLGKYQNRGYSNKWRFIKASRFCAI